MIQGQWEHFSTYSPGVNSSFPHSVAHASLQQRGFRIIT